jgi:hypothetical protein
MYGPAVKTDVGPTDAVQAPRVFYNFLTPVSLPAYQGAFLFDEPAAVVH